VGIECGGTTPGGGLMRRERRRRHRVRVGLPVRAGTQAYAGITPGILPQQLTRGPQAWIQTHADSTFDVDV
jgi:hypothetical protein